MSGHSKWSTIKHKKALTDAKKASAFTKLAKDVTIAAREGGDPEMNFRLRMAIDKARSANMPKDNIEKAIKRGTGELKDGAQIEEAVYEAYGPGQVAMLIKVATDNKNRSYSEIKNLIGKNGGKMVEGGSVSWQFEPVGVINLNSEKTDENIELAIIEGGAVDYFYDKGEYVIFTKPVDLRKVKDKLEERFKISNAQLSFRAKESVAPDDKTRDAYANFVEVLEQHDDISEIFDNLK